MLKAIQRGGDQPAVPTVWHAEVAGVLLRRLRANALSEDRFEQALRAFSALPLQTHGETLMFDLIVDRARRYDLQAGDTLYFDLAVRLRAPLATIDGGLKAGAGRFGVPLFDPPAT